MSIKIFNKQNIFKKKQLSKFEEKKLKRFSKKFKYEDLNLFKDKPII